MTRANTEQLKSTPWFANAGAACSIIPISRFVSETIFALKGGGYGCLFSLSGVDEESLTDLDLDSRVRAIEGALRGLPEGACLYQYTRVRAAFETPRANSYQNPVTEAFAADRFEFLKQNASFRRIDLHWCLTVEPAQAKSFKKTPEMNAHENARMFSELEKSASLLTGHLASSVGLSQLGKTETFKFFSYLFNLEDWATANELRSDLNVDRQLVQNPIAWHKDTFKSGNGVSRCIRC